MEKRQIKKEYSAMQGLNSLETSLILNFQLYLDNHKIRLHTLLNQKINNPSNIQIFLQKLKLSLIHI